MKKRLCYFILPISIYAISHHLSAEIVTDGSLGPKVSINGPNFLIGEDLGSRAGNNLFHSFNTFSIHSGESATFTGSADIDNVISRVTGGTISSIDGLLESQIGAADFYFINPAGIIFGQNAQINVPAAFHASTAETLSFSDGFQFDATNSNASSLSVATPSSFGFTEQQTAKISMDGSLLSAQDKQHFSLTSTNIEADSAQILSKSGIVSMVATGPNDTTVALDQPLLEQSQLTASGSLKLNNTQIDVSGNGGGQINIAAGDAEMSLTDLFNTNIGDSNEILDSNILLHNLEADNTWIKNDSTGAGQSPSINLIVENNIDLSFGSILSSSAFAQGDANNVFVSAKNLSIDRQGSSNLTGIVSNANLDSTGNAGLVEIQLSGALDILNQGEIGSNTFAAGNAGVVLIEADSIYIDGKNADGLTGISSQATSSSSGDAGFIDIKVSDSFEIYDSGVVSTSTFSEGSAGDINIITNNLFINRFDADNTTGIFSNSSGNASGDAGNISITNNDWIAVVNGGKISSSTFADGNAGDIKIDTKQLYLDDSGSFYLTGIISNAESQSTGNAGNLDIKVSGLTEIYAGATIGSNTFSNGHAGTVNIHSGEILVDDLGANTLTGFVSQTNSTGHAGELNITVDGLFTLQNGGEVSTNTFGEGNAGTINIQTSDLKIDHQNSEILTGIVSNSGGKGYAGSVNLNVTNHADIINGGQIASSSFAEGDAGEVSVSAGTMTINRQNNNSVTGILSNAQEDSLGEAGTVSVEVAGLLQILNGGKIVSNTNSVGDAGSVLVTAGNLYMDALGSQYFTGISSNAEFGSTGNAGFVSVDVSGLTTILSAAEIGSNTFADGDAGLVQVQTGQLLIDTIDTLAITGIFSDAVEGSKGNAGLLKVTVDETAILQNGGKIGSNTYSSGHAGDINLTAKNLIINGKDYPFDTGVTSIAKSDSSGDAGSIDIQVSENLTVKNGGEISTNTASSGNAGLITVKAKNIDIDREGNDRFTGIFSDAEFGSSGHAGSLRVTVTDSLNIINGAWLSSNTESSGNAGDIEIISDSINLDAKNTGILTGIYSDALDGSTGDAGTISINNSGTLSVINGASIASITEAEGNAGMVAIQSENLFISLDESSVRTGIFSDATPSSIGDAGFLDLNIDQALQIIKGGSISSTTFGLGDAGAINLVATTILLDGQGARSTGIFSSSESLDKGQAGSIDITVNDTMTILDGAAIGSNTFSKGNAGFIDLKGKNLVINGETSTLFTGIASQAGDSSGNAGFLNVEMSNQIDLLHGGKISTNTFALGNAGDIQIKTKNLNIDRQANQAITTGIFSNTRSTDDGNAGSIEIQASGFVNVLGGGEIASNTYSNGNAGFVSVFSDTLLLDVNNSFLPTGIFSDAETGSSGHAGTVFVKTINQLEIYDGASISSNTEQSGNAGDIEIVTGSLTIDATDSGFLTGILSNAKEGSTGNAGSINITNSGNFNILNGGTITSLTEAEGNAGSIDIRSNNLLLDAGNTRQSTGILSDARENSAGNAGQININVDNHLNILNGAKISTNTQGLGNAGDIQITAKNIDIDGKNGFSTGIFSNSKSTDIGHAGSINLKVLKQLNIYNGGEISSNTFSKGDAGQINIESNNLLIDYQQTDPNLFFGPSGIFSDAKELSEGNAGSIFLTVNDTLELSGNANISSNTSSLGTAGNINIASGNLIIDAAGSIFADEIFSDNLSFATGISSDAKFDSKGSAGSININNQESIQILNGARISSDTQSYGDAGDIDIKSGSLDIIRNDANFNSQISSNASEGALGNAGYVSIFVDHSLYINDGNISSDVQFVTMGNAGDIDIKSNGSIVLENGGFISSSTFGEGNSGNIEIITDDLQIDRQDSPYPTGIFTESFSTGSGFAGFITVNAENNINIINGGQINSNTISEGDAGVIQLRAENISMDRSNSSNFTGIFSDAKTDSGGNAGSIQLFIDKQLTIKNGAWISSNTESIGNAGDIEVSAHGITLDAQDSGIITGILSNAKETSSGDAGQIEVTAPGLLEILGGAEISSNTESSGNAGTININAGYVVIDTNDSTFFTGIFSQAEVNSKGNAGQLDLTVQEELSIYDAGKINTNTYGPGNAGDIQITAKNITIDRQGGFSTGIFSDAKENSEGHAGSIQLDVTEKLTIDNGAWISSNTEASGNAGDIVIGANNISLDAQDSGIITGILSNAKETSSGDAGQIKINAPGLLEVLGGAEISSNTESIGDAGEINIEAGNIKIDTQGSGFITGVFSNAELNSQGNAGQLIFNVQNDIEIIDGGAVSTNTDGLGNAGDIDISTAQLLIDRKSSFATGVFSNTSSTTGDAGSIKIEASDTINILSGGEISSNTFSKGNAGVIEIQAKNLNIERQNSSKFTGIFSDAKAGSEGNAGSIHVDVTDNIQLNNGRITSNTGENSLGHAGQIFITSGKDINLSNSSEIGSNTNAKGDAGQIIVKAKNLYLNGKEAQFRTGIFSNAEETSSGNAGTIQVDIEDQLSIVNGSGISSNTYATGDAGDITVSASSIILDGEDTQFRTGISSNAEDTSSGDAGFIQITSSGPMHIVSSARVSSDTHASGNAGNIIIEADSLNIDTEQGNFSSGIYSSAQSGSSGNAGAILMTVHNSFDINNARVSSDADENSSGNAGFIELSVKGKLNILNEAEIGSNTAGLGNAGDLSIHAGDIYIDNQNSPFFTGIGSDTYSTGSGNAGTITVSVDNRLEIMGDGTISSSSSTPGNAGEIFIQTKELLIDAQYSQFSSISSESFPNSSGQVGNIEIVAETINLNNGTEISIGALAENLSDDSYQNHYIAITANDIVIQNNSTINAESQNNSPAASILINTSGNLELISESSISTESLVSDGGPITINSGLININNSLITTSVEKLGNGGNISVTTPTLIMKSGFIQGNTGAIGASGGDILIDTPQLIFPSNQTFLTNQDERIAFQPNAPFNVIQAAAPDGVSGNVTVTAPTLDISSSILNISTRFSDQTKISKNPCKVSAGEIPSSLTWAGQGGLPTSHSDSINLPLGRRLLIIEPKHKQKDSNHNDANHGNPTNKSKLDCVASR